MKIILYPCDEQGNKLPSVQYEGEIPRFEDRIIIDGVDHNVNGIDRIVKNGKEVRVDVYGRRYLR
jgi:hypothetical protein